VTVTRLVRDPGSIPRHHPGSERDLGQVGYWSAGERQRQDEAFAAAMQAAGYSATLPSTHFGTRNPVANYQRE